MAWYCNEYRCPRCNCTWYDEWSCMCDDECPNCGCRHIGPIDAENLSVTVTQTHEGEFEIVYSSPNAEHDPAYIVLARTKNPNLIPLFENIAAKLAAQQPS